MTTADHTVVIYCDGACSGNPGPGGWGAVLLYKEHKKEIQGYEPDTTNNRMEIMAAIMAISAVIGQVKIRIYTDSQYLRNGITVWIKSWLKTNWKQGKVKNQDLWQQLLVATEGREIEWHWVKGHAGNVHNERADVLANNAIKEGLQHKSKMKRV